MKLARLWIQTFCEIKEETLLSSGHVVLIGDNNVGKTTVYEQRHVDRASQQQGEWVSAPSLRPHPGPVS